MFGLLILGLVGSSFVSLKRSEAVSFYTSGRSYIARGSIDLGGRQLERALLHDAGLVPSDASLRLATASFILGISRQPVFEQALIQRPGDPRLHMVLGVSALLQDDPEIRQRGEERILKAFEIANHQNQLRLDTALAYQNLAGHYYQSKRYREAADLYARATQLRPNYPKAWYLLAQTRRFSEDLEPAYQAIRQALAWDSDRSEFWVEYLNIGGVYHTHGQFDTALDIYREVVEAIPEHPAVHINLGILHYSAGRYGESVLSFEQAVALSPESADAHLGLAQAYERSDRIGEAIRAYRRALSLNPESTEARLNLNALLQRKPSG